MKSFKKILLALIVVATACGIADAQKIRFGVKAGLNVNDIRVSNIKELTDNAAGFTAGVMAEFQVPLIGIGADVSLMYTRMNSEPKLKFETTAGETDSQIKQNNNFLEIPINLKYKFSLPVVGSFLAPYIFTGPDFAFKLGKDTFKDIKTKTCQVAWNVGLGVELIKHVQIGASYGFGINNIVSKVADNIVNAKDIKLRNNYWTVTAAYLF